MCLVRHVCLFSSCDCYWADLSDSVRGVIAQTSGQEPRGCAAWHMCWPVQRAAAQRKAWILLWSALHLRLPKAQHRPALWFWLGCFALSALLASSKEEFPWLFSVVVSLLLPLYA